MLHCFVGVCKITCLACWRALRAGVLTSTLIGLLGCFRAVCLCSCMLGVLNVSAYLRATCSRVWLAHMYICSRVWHVCLFYVLTCSQVLCACCAQISYVLACFSDIVCPIFFFLHLKTSSNGWATDFPLGRQRFNFNQSVIVPAVY